MSLKASEDKRTQIEKQVMEHATRSDPESLVRDEIVTAEY